MYSGPLTGVAASPQIHLGIALNAAYAHDFPKMTFALAYCLKDIEGVWFVGGYARKNFYDSEVRWIEKIECRGGSKEDSIWKLAKIISFLDAEIVEWPR